jgi:hypothetical protein
MQEHLDNSMDLALRLFLMVKIQRSGTSPKPYATLGESVIYWDENESLDETLKKEFQSIPTHVHRDREFSSLLTAHNLELYGGFRIAWTSNLAEHLRITKYNNFTEVALYHYATVMHWHESQYVISHLSLLRAE